MTETKFGIHDKVFAIVYSTTVKAQTGWILAAGGVPLRVNQITIKAHEHTEYRLATSCRPWSSAELFCKAAEAQAECDRRNYDIGARRYDAEAAG